MPRKLYLIEDITQKIDPNWCVKIRVLEKHPARSVANSPRKYQNYVFGDKMGSRVQAIIWGNEIALFAKRLHVFKTYYISRATVKPCITKFQIVPSPNEWVIHGRTVVQECELNDPELDAAPLHFAPYSIFPAYLNSAVHLDIIGIVMDMDVPKKASSRYGMTYVQEAIIINQELKPVMLAFWDTHVENECVRMYSQRAQYPVIIVFRVKVTPYNGMSLSAKNSSGVITAPEMPAAFELRQWFDEKKQEILATFNPIDYYSSRSSAIPTKEDDLKTLAQGMTMAENAMFWTKATAAVVNYMQRFFYVSCSSCSKSTGFDPGEIYFCNYCDEKTAIATPRCALEIQLKDSTAVLQAQVYAEVAESLIGCKACDLSKVSNMDDISALQKLIKLDEDGVYLFQIKGIEDSFSQTGIKKYTIYQAQLFNLNSVFPTQAFHLSSNEASTSGNENTNAPATLAELTSMVDEPKEIAAEEIAIDVSQSDFSSQPELSA